MNIPVGTSGKASVRFDVRVVQARGGGAVAEGYTVHAVTGPGGKPARPPQWFVNVFEADAEQ